MQSGPSITPGYNTIRSHALGAHFLFGGTYLGGQHPFTSDSGPQQSYAKENHFFNQPTHHSTPYMGGLQGFLGASPTYD